MEKSPPNAQELAQTHDAIYEQNHVVLLDLMGRIVVGLARNYRTDKPRSEEHIGGQEEMIAMLTDIADSLQA